MRIIKDQNFRNLDVSYINGQNISQILTKINLNSTINTSVNPTGSAVTPDGKYLYVANNNNYSIPGQDCITVIDLSTNLPLTTIHDNSFYGPYTITINGNLAYVTNSNGSTITIIDTSTNTVSGVINGFDGPSGLAIKGTTGYVNNYGATTPIFTGSISGTTLTVSSIIQGKIIPQSIITSNGTFTGSIAGTVLTVTSMIDGVIGVGSTITGSGVTSTTITSLGTGTGGPGTYNIGTTQTVASTTITSTQAGGSTIQSGTTITGYGTGSGGVGTYTVSISQSVASTTIGTFTIGIQSGNGNTVSVVDLVGKVITGTINVGLAPAAIAITPDLNNVIVANYVDGNPGNGYLSNILTSNNSVTSIGNGLSGPFKVAISPDSSKAYITNFGSNNFTPFGNTLSVVNLNTGNIIATVTLGIQPAGICLTLSGKYAYVSNYNTLYAYVFQNQYNNLTPGQGTVNIVDLTTYKLLPITIPVGQSPSDLFISPDGNYVYVSNYTSNTVNVIRNYLI